MAGYANIHWNLKKKNEILVFKILNILSKQYRYFSFVHLFSWIFCLRSLHPRIKISKRITQSVIIRWYTIRSMKWNPWESIMKDRQFTNLNWNYSLVVFNIYFAQRTTYLCHSAFLPNRPNNYSDRNPHYWHKFHYFDTVPSQNIHSHLLKENKQHEWCML